MAGVKSDINFSESTSRTNISADMACLGHLLADVFARPGLAIGKRLGKLLDGACAAYRMDYAYITLIKSEIAEVSFSSTVSKPYPSSLAAVQTTTDWIVQNAHVLALPNAALSPHAKLCDQMSTRPARFLGAPVEFDGRVYGTVELVGSTLQTTPFTDIELSLMRMIAIYAAAPLILLGQS